MSNCVECQYTHLVWYHDADLPTPVAALVEAHIDDCLPCRTEAAGEQAVAKIVRRVSVERAPASLKMRIQAQFVALSYDSGESVAE
jgi:anti-sigma factor (TIGR02949 family)